MIFLVQLSSKWCNGFIDSATCVLHSQPMLSKPALLEIFSLYSYDDRFLLHWDARRRLLYVDSIAFYALFFIRRGVIKLVSLRLQVFSQVDSMIRHFHSVAHHLDAATTLISSAACNTALACYRERGVRNLQNTAVRCRSFLDCVSRSADCFSSAHFFYCSSSALSLCIWSYSYVGVCALFCFWNCTDVHLTRLINITYLLGQLASYVGRGAGLSNTIEVRPTTQIPPIHSTFVKSA